MQMLVLIALRGNERYGDTDLNTSGKQLLQLCCNNVIPITNIYFQSRDSSK